MSEMPWKKKGTIRRRRKGSKGNGEREEKP